MNDNQESDRELVTELLSTITRLNSRPCVQRICVRCGKECCCNELVQYPMHEWCEAFESWQYVD
jgi:hypothetical protein